jgi:fatty acid desaturase
VLFLFRDPGACAQALRRRLLRRLKSFPLRGLETNVKLKLAVASLLLLASTGCVVVGGYSSGRGFWLWPGSIVFLLIGLFLLLMMVFRRR